MSVASEVKIDLTARSQKFEADIARAAMLLERDMELAVLCALTAASDVSPDVTKI